MELRDYLRMLRRGWPTIALVTLLGVGLSLLYVVVTPKKYVATSVLLISPHSAGSLTDLQQGSQYAVSAAATYAQIISSAAVLGPVAEQLGKSVNELQGVVTASSQQTTALIFIEVRTSSGVSAADIANATAKSAARVIPPLAAGQRQHAALIAMHQVRAASVPSTPVSPNSSRITLIGFAVGLALGLALAIARQALDTKLRALEDVEAVTRIPTLAVIPRLTGKQRTGVVVRDFPHSAVGENYRSLRTNLARLESGERRSITCAGVADDREGAQIALNLGWSFANVGWRVLVIDLDLRQSPLSSMLRLADDGPGAAGLLAGEAEIVSSVRRPPSPHHRPPPRSRITSSPTPRSTRPQVDTRWRQALRHTDQENLDVIVAGRAHGNPSDLLGGHHTARLLRSVEAAYDYVVVHVPPLLAYTDAAVVARVTGHTLVTVSARRTRAADLTNAVGVLRNVQVEPVGLVLAGTRALTNDIISFHGVRSRSSSAAQHAPLSEVAQPTPLARPAGSR